MKIAIDISQIVYKGTGVAVYTENLVRNIAAIDKKNQYLLFGSSLRNTKILRKFCEELKENKNFEYKIFSYPPSFLSLLWNKMHVLSIDKLIGKVDVLHTSDWLEPPSYAKKVTTIHDLVVFVDPENTPKSIKDTHLKKLSWVAKETDKIIAVSGSTKKDIEKYLKIPPSKIEVIYEAASEIFQESENKTKNKYFLVVGTSKRKNLENIIAAFEKLGLKDARLVITGRKLKHKNNLITEVGYVEEKELARLYSGALALVYVPTYEGFGLPVLEALSCNCQVVSSNVSSLPEVGGNAVFYCDPKSVSDIADKMLMAINNPKTNLISQAKKFSWEKTARQTVQFYESLA